MNKPFCMTDVTISLLYNASFIVTILLANMFFLYILILTDVIP